MPSREIEYMIDYAGDKWTTYIIDERDAVMTGTQLYFNSEGEALDDLIRRLRSIKKIVDIELKERREKTC